MLPAACLAAGLAQDELAQRNDQPGFLGQRNEVRRRDQSALRVAPAHQCLGGLQAVIGQTQARLVEDFQLADFQRLAQLVLQLQVVHAGCLRAVGEELQGVAAQVLGLLHGGAGLAQQDLGIAAVVRQQADTDGGADHQLLFADDDRLADALQQTTAQVRQTAEAAVGVEQHDEFVAGQAGDGVGLTEGLAQPSRHLAQQRIGRLVAEAFIEQLETVQIDIQHRHVAAVAAHPLTGFLQPLLQQAAVGQPGEIVVMGQVAQTLLDLAPHAEVGDEGDHMGDAAVGITHLAQLHPLRIDLAALARLDQLALPVAVPLQRLAHGLVLPLALRRAGDTRHAVAEQFLAAVAGQRAAGVIHRQNTVAIVHDHDAFAGGLEHRGGQALLLGLTAQLADVTARADHAQRTAIGVTLDHPPAVFQA